MPEPTYVVASSPSGAGEAAKAFTPAASVPKPSVCTATHST